MRDCFGHVLARYEERLNDTGFRERNEKAPRDELLVQDLDNKGNQEISDWYFDEHFQARFLKHAGLAQKHWDEAEQDLRRELRRARRDQITAFLCTQEERKPSPTIVANLLFLRRLSFLSLCHRLWVRPLMISWRNMPASGQPKQSVRTGP